MSTSVTLGFTPYPISVVLARDGAFTTQIVADPTSPWPAGIAAELRLSPRATATPVATWPATVTAEALTWDVPAAQVAAALDAGAARVRLIYTTAGGEALLWASGGVHGV